MIVYVQMYAHDYVDADVDLIGDGDDDDNGDDARGKLVMMMSPSMMQELMEIMISVLIVEGEHECFVW